MPSEFCVAHFLLRSALYVILHRKAELARRVQARDVGVGVANGLPAGMAVPLAIRAWHVQMLATAQPGGELDVSSQQQQSLLR